MLSSYPFNVDYEVGDLVMIAHSVEFMGTYVRAGEVAIITLMYDRSFTANNPYDCVVILKCGFALDCWFGELINLTRLDL